MSRTDLLLLGCRHLGFPQDSLLCQGHCHSPGKSTKKKDLHYVTCLLISRTNSHGSVSNQKEVIFSSHLTDSPTWFSELTALQCLPPGITCLPYVVSNV
ncbi:hypothetical protein VULLAG_LOCUS11970 [Vulpes lagopus]